MWRLQLTRQIPCPALWAVQLQMCAHLGRARSMATWMEGATETQTPWSLLTRRGPIWNVPTLFPKGRSFSLLKNSCAEKVAHLAGRTAGAWEGRCSWLPSSLGWGLPVSLPALQCHSLVLILCSGKPTS